MGIMKFFRFVKRKLKYETQKATRNLGKKASVPRSSQPALIDVRRPLCSTPILEMRNGGLRQRRKGIPSVRFSRGFDDSASTMYQIGELDARLEKEYVCHKNGSRATPRRTTVKYEEHDPMDLEVSRIERSRHDAFQFSPNSSVDTSHFYENLSVSMKEWPATGRAPEMYASWADGMSTTFFDEIDSDVSEASVDDSLDELYDKSVLYASKRSVSRASL